jgi:hypothetical protein
MKKPIFASMILCLCILFGLVGCTPTVRVEYANPTNDDILAMPFTEVPAYVSGSDLEYEKSGGTTVDNFEGFVEEYEAVTRTTLNTSQRLNIRIVVMPKLMYVGHYGWSIRNSEEDANLLVQQYTIKHVNEILAVIYR